MDDITQQGFSSQCYHGAGISMEPHSPFPAHRFVLLPDPNLLKGPSEWRNRAVEQALGINLAWVLVLYHPYSSPLSAFFHPSACLCLSNWDFPRFKANLNINVIKRKKKALKSCSAAKQAEGFLFLLHPDCFFYIKAGSKIHVLPFIVWLPVCTIQWPLLQISPDTSNKDVSSTICALYGLFDLHTQA